MKAGSFIQRLKSMAGGAKSEAAQSQGPATLASPVRHPYGAFRFKAHLAAGSTYEVQATTNLKNWISIYTDTAPAEMEYVDSNAEKYSYRFYRLLVEGVLSENVVGYATIRVPPGFSLISHPLRVPDHRVSEVLKALPSGATLNKYDPRISKMTENILYKDGKWKEPNQQFTPGEGLMVLNPTGDDLHLNFAGEVKQDGFLLPIPPGFSMLGSPVPQAGRLHEDLGFPITAGDIIHLYDRDKQKYVPHEFNGTTWTPEAPVVGVGEGFLVAKQSGMNWKRDALDKGIDNPSTPTK